MNGNRNLKKILPTAMQKMELLLLKIINRKQVVLYKLQYVSVLHFLNAVLHKEMLSKTSNDEIFSPQIRIHSVKQFGTNAKLTTNKNNNSNFSYEFGWSYLETPDGKGIAKGVHGNGFQHYLILFPASGKGIFIMTNSDNGESIYKELLEYANADIYTLEITKLDTR
jgi:hypothetical protein